MTFACIQGWIAHMKKSVLPFGAVIVASAESPGLGPTNTESPGRSNCAGASCAMLFSTYRCAGGASLLLFGSTPNCPAIVMQTVQLFIWLVVRGRSFLLTM